MYKGRDERAYMNPRILTTTAPTYFAWQPPACEEGGVFVRRFPPPPPARASVPRALFAEDAPPPPEGVAQRAVSAQRAISGVSTSAGSADLSEFGGWLLDANVLGARKPDTALQQLPLRFQRPQPLAPLQQAQPPRGLEELSMTHQFSRRQHVSSRRVCEESLRRVERKLDLIMLHLGLAHNDEGL